MKTYAVIMAGGVGSRFWPMSRKKFPKQFLKLFGERSMIQQTVDRIRPVVPDERVLIITNEAYIPIIQEQLPDIPRENIFGEPIAKNTAPCVGLAAKIIEDRDPGSVMFVLPSDHLIADEEEYQNVMMSAAKAADSNQSLVTIGITPSHPETGYGYIQFDESSSSEFEEHRAHSVKQFTEKPDKDTAESFLKSGDYLWNSGMFIWRTDVIIDQMNKHLPAVSNHFDVIDESAAKTADNRYQQLYTFYDRCESISVDYGVMERADQVDVVPGDFGWNDVGSWLAVYELNDKDEYGNVTNAEYTSLIETKNSYVKTSGDKLIALVGLEDVAVIETEDAILVCNLNETQDVKQVVNSLNGQLERFR